MNNPLGEVTVLIPVGGKATRALGITNGEFPKHLIYLDNNETILGVICRQLYNIGFRNFVFCTGHHKEQIKKYVSETLWNDNKDVIYKFSEENTPLGPDGAVLEAIRRYHIEGNALIVPGDTLLPWIEIAEMCKWHFKQSCEGITMGVSTDYPKYDTSGGIIVGNKESDLILGYHINNTKDPISKDWLYYKSAAATVTSVAYFTKLCTAFSSANTPGIQLNLRHEILPWALDNNFIIRKYEVSGNLVDVGTVANINYIRNNHQEFTQ